MEEWRRIEGWPYEVSNLGRVRRVGPVLTNQIDAGGYAMVNLSAGGRRWRVGVHRLVAAAFLGPPPTEEHQVNHLDGQKDNPSAENLQWVTPRENVEHAVATGLMRGRKGEAHPLSVLTREAVAEMRRDFRRGHADLRELAARNGVHLSTARDAVRGKTWAHVPGAVTEEAPA